MARNSLLMLIGLIACVRTGPVFAGPINCLECHGDDLATKNAAATIPQTLKESTHGSLSCTDCHASVEMKEGEGASQPHGSSVPKVNCGTCHSDEAEAYTKHGRLETGKNPDLPQCWSCHGSHDIFPSSDRRSRVYHSNMPNTCRSCHTNVDLVKNHASLREKPIEKYESSVHGRATGNVLRGAAACQDCHAAADAKGRQTAHRILSPSDPQSTTYHFNIPNTCGKCHAEIARQYKESTHGQFAARGESDAPVCTSCHGEHGIISPKDEASPVNAIHVAQETCAPCHESELLNEKYGLPGGRLASYIDSYHGLKSRAGDVRVANCASCHGAHRILPSSDARSSIFPANLQRTCGKCHPGIGAEFAQAKIHQAERGLRSTWAGVFRGIYLVLIFCTIGFMLLHNGADWLRAVRQLKSVAYVRRLSGNETAQHWVLALSFTVLVISGFSLRFSEAGWVKFLFGWKGGFVARGVIHRFAAVVMIVGAAWHLLYLLFSHAGHHWFRDMLANRGDIRHFRENFAYYFGRRKHAPRFGRFSYMEKMEYWALIWGTMIMAGTGLLLWFDNFFVDVLGLPKGLLDVMLVIHYYEAWLAFLAILVWHIYGTVFKPGVYPMNPAWISGKMPKTMYAHEHPDGPHMKGHMSDAGSEQVGEAELVGSDGKLDLLPSSPTQPAVKHRPLFLETGVTDEP